MKKFLKEILSSQSEASSKRFAAIISLFSIVIITFLATLRAERWVTPEFMFDALVIITGGGLGLTVIEKIFSKPTTPTQKEAQPETPNEANLESPGEKDI
jgi:hypothetical protein